MTVAATPRTGISATSTRLAVPTMVAGAAASVVSAVEASGAKSFVGIASGALVTAVTLASKLWHDQAIHTAAIAAVSDVESVVPASTPVIDALQARVEAVEKRVQSAVEPDISAITNAVLKQIAGRTTTI